MRPYAVLLVALLATLGFTAKTAFAQAPPGKPDPDACVHGDIAQEATLLLAQCDALLATPGGKRDPFAYLNHGAAHVQLGQRDLAIADFTMAITLEPTMMQALIDRAEMYRAMGRGELAREDYTAVTRLRPHNAEEFLSRGTAFDRMGDLKAAFDDYDQSVKRHPAIISTLEQALRFRASAAFRLKEAAAPTSDLAPNGR